jgi:hypothetical protein
MEMTELVLTLGDQQGLKFPKERAEKMAEKGGTLDMTLLIRKILFQLDVKGFRPQDDLRFDFEEAPS